jgi:hypothetical protein
LPKATSFVQRTTSFEAKPQHRLPEATSFYDLLVIDY